MQVRHLQTATCEHTATIGGIADDGGASRGEAGSCGGSCGNRHIPAVLGGRPTPICRKVYMANLMSVCSFHINIH